jgi:hypothetical protein
LVRDSTGHDTQEEVHANAKQQADLLLAGDGAVKKLAQKGDGRRVSCNFSTSRRAELTIRSINTPSRRPIKNPHRNSVPVPSLSAARIELFMPFMSICASMATRAVGTTLSAETYVATVCR